MIICLIVAGMLSVALVRHILYFIYHSNYKKYDKLEDSIGDITQGNSTSDQAVKKKFYRAQRIKFGKLEDKLAFDGELSSAKSVVGSLNAVFSFVGLILICVVLIIVHSPRNITRSMDFLAMDKQSIEYRLEQLETAGASDLYLYKDAIQDANDFNKRVYVYKWRLANPWINWFTPKAYTRLEPIDYDYLIESTKSNTQ